MQVFLFCFVFTFLFFLGIWRNVKEQDANESFNTKNLEASLEPIKSCKKPYLLSKEDGKNVTFRYL